MNILIAPDKFKGSATAKEVCSAIAAGLNDVGINTQIHVLPLADGGEGTLAALSEHAAFQKKESAVLNPLGKTINTWYLYDAKQEHAFIELAAASGLTLLSFDQRNCLYTSTLGTGMQIIQAIENGAKEIILGIGGSATNDAGMGILQELGFTFLDIAANPLEPIGENLNRVEEIIFPSFYDDLKTIKFTLLCDVNNPLFGDEGAAFVYAPQKGADEFAVNVLDEGLRHFAKTSARCLGKDFSLEAGTGAAGGVGFGMRAFLKASLKPGIDVLMQLLNFDQYAQEADFIISGEGKIDTQTLSGKVLAGVQEKAKRFDKKLIIVAGRIDIDITKHWPEANAFSLMDIAKDEQDAMQHTVSLLRTLAKNKISPIIKSITRV
jgi:glycerate 2-kinase